MGLKEKEQGSRMFWAQDVMENGQEWKSLKESAHVEEDQTSFLCSQDSSYKFMSSSSNSKEKQTTIKSLL